MYDDEHCLESIATTIPLPPVPVAAPTGENEAGVHQGGMAALIDDDADTADDISVEELDTGESGLDLLCDDEDDAMVRPFNAVLTLLLLNYYFQIYFPISYVLYLCIY